MTEEHVPLPKTIQDILADEHQPSRPADGRRSPIPAWGWMTLMMILMMAGMFRFTGLNWDQFTHLHPDERFLTMVASRVQGVTSPIEYLRTSTSTLNPYNVQNGDGSMTFPSYVYGNFPMTVTRYSAEFVATFCQTQPEGCTWYERQIQPIGYDGVHLVGRFLSASIDMIAVLFVFLIGQRLYDHRVGLIGAAFYAMAAQPIQQAHFFTADNWSTGLATIAIYCAVRASEYNQKRWYALFGIFLGLSTASRINIAPLAVLAGVAALVWLARNIGSWERLRTQRGFDYLLQAATGVMLAALLSMATFRLAMPYAFNDIQMAREAVRLSREAEVGTYVSIETVSAANPMVWLRAGLGFNPHWVANMEEIQRLQQPDAVFPPALQWVDRPALIFPFTNMLFWGLGLMAGLTSWMGVLWAIGHVRRNRPEFLHHLIPLSWTLLYFLFMGTRWVKNNRYFLPIYPTLVVLGGWALIEMWNHSAERRGWRRVMAGGMIAMALAGSFMWTNAFMTVYREDFTRVEASEWFIENIPSGATLLVESDGATQEVQLPVKNHFFQVGGAPLIFNFTIPEGGTITGLRFNYLTDEQTIDVMPRLRVTISDASMANTLTSAEAMIDARQPRSAVTIGLPQADISAEQQVTIFVEMLEGGVLLVDTSAVLNEHWDDPLPVRANGIDPYGFYYRGVRDEINGFDGSAPITNPDSYAKLEDFVRWLDNADVVVLSSQRAVWSTTRLPMTYPLTTRDFEALFGGELGLDMAAQFHADMAVGPLYVSDVGGNVNWGSPPEVGWPPPRDLTSAEEAFSVYDHPPVWIFKKTESYNSDLVRLTLSSVDLDQTVFMNPGQATTAPTALRFEEGVFSAQQLGGTFTDLFNPDSLLNRQPAVAAIVWYIAVVVLGWLALPLTFSLFSSLPTRGYALSRILVLLLISYFGWITASLNWLPNQRSTYVIGLLLVAALSISLAIRNRAALSSFIRQNSSFILRVELIALGLFLLSLFIRAQNPDVWHVIWGGEKPMDLTYFTAVLKSSQFPPYDPWYAGGFLNYYYYGFVFVGALTQLLGIVPTLAYNLIIPMLFSFTGIGAFSIAYNLTAWREKKQEVGSQEQAVSRGPIIAGLVAVTLSTLLGNLAQIGTIVQYYSADFFYPGNWFWNASRAISVPEGEIGPITEFPFFTFLYADLHAHMIALPLTMLALGWVINFGLRQSPASPDAPDWLNWLVGALAVGVLFPTNSWDWPTYLVLAILGIVLHNLRRYKTLTWPMLANLSWQIAVLGILSYALFLPFHSTFGAGFSEIALWEGSKTGIGSYLSIYGLFLLLSVVYTASQFRSWASSLSVSLIEKVEPFLLPIGLTIALVLAIMAASVMAGYPIAPIALLMIISTGLLALSSGLPTNHRIALALISSSFALTLFVDVFVIEGTVGRMNTVFKFYFQVWMLLSVVGGVAFAGVLGRSQGWGFGRKSSFYAAFGVLVAIAALYPLTATRAKWNIRMSEEAPTTLDGMAFMETATYDDSGQRVSLKPDYDALRWMQRNIEGSPVVAEAYSGNYYRSAGNRVAMYTGLPTIIGWAGHQGQQRAAVPDAKIQERVFDVEQLYNTIDPTHAQFIIEKYDVSYIYVGPLERIYYTQLGLAKFDQMITDGLLEPVYSENEVTIYRVLETAQASN